MRVPIGARSTGQFLFYRRAALAEAGSEPKGVLVDEARQIQKQRQERRIVEGRRPGPARCPTTSATTSCSRTTTRRQERAAMPLAQVQEQGQWEYRPEMNENNSKVPQLPCAHTHVPGGLASLQKSWSDVAIATHATLVLSKDQNDWKRTACRRQTDVGKTSAA